MRAFSTSPAAATTRLEFPADRLSLAQRALACAVVRPFRLERALLWRGMTPARVGLKADAWSVEAAPGVVLRGWHTHPREGQARRGTVVLLHGISSCKEALLPLAGWLAAEGYGCLLYDGRAHGGSGGRFCTYGFFERHDFSRVLDHAEARGGPLGPVAAWGTSLGGAVALQAMEIDPRVGCGIVESTFATLREVAGAYQRRLLKWPSPALTAWALAGAERLARFPVDAVRPEETAGRLRQPVLLIHGDRDRNIPPAHGARIFARLRAPGSRWLAIPGGTHHRLGQRHGGTAYFAAMRDFLAAHCH